MSSGVTPGYLIQKEPLKTAIKLATLFNCSTESSEKLIQCLRTVPAKEINNKFEEMRVISLLKYC